MSLPNNWQPSYNEKYTRYMLDKYKGKAHLLPEDEQKRLQEHAEAYNIPFYTGDFSLLDAIGQAGAGFIEGFTTLNIADHPDNEYEQIFRNLGHLAGFAPGIMSKPAALLGRTALGKAIGARTFAKAASQIKSIPMKGADIVTNYAKQAVKTTGKSFVGRSEAMKTARNFVMGNRARHIVEGAFHLGTASAISSWQGGVDQMIEAGMGGALAGGVFRAIGNLTPGTSTHEKVGKALAGSLFQGLPSTMRGATTPEQIYEYVMGAYFGGNEVSWTRAKAGKFMKKMDEWGRNEKTQKDAIRSGMDPEFHPEFNKLPEEVKPMVKEQAAKVFGSPEANMQKNMPFLLMEELGLKGELTEQQLLDQGATLKEYRDGKAVYSFSEKVIAEKFASYLTSGNLSGDNYFARQADKYGIPAIQYSFGQKGRKAKGVGYQRILSAEDLQDAELELQKAEGRLKRGYAKGKTEKETENIRNLQRTNWYKVRYADSVYVVGEFENNKRSMKGVPGIAAQMAIQNNKPVYAFGEKDGRWFKWNPGAKKFTEAGTPPRPTRRFAGITDSGKLSEKGKQAIRSLFSENYTPVQSATETVAKDSISKQKQARIKSLKEEIDTTQEIYNEKVLDIRLKRQVGEDTTQAELELQDIANHNKDLVERYTRLANFSLAAKSITPEIDYKRSTSSEISDKADVDFEGPVNLEVGKLPLQFTIKHLEKSWGSQDTVLLKQNKKRELAQLVEETLLETTDGTPIKEGGIPLYLRPNQKENLSENWAKAVQEKIRNTYEEPNFTLSNEAKQDMRKWMTRKNLGRQVYHLQSDGNTIKPMTNPKAPITLAGNRKLQEEPIKRIEEAHMEAGGKSPQQEPIYMVLDHVTIEGKNGRRDVDISDYRTKHSSDYKQMMVKAIKDMSKKGYYPLGGKGDADRIVWVKYHPSIAKATNAQLKKALNEIGLGRELASSFRDFKKEYKGTLDDFRRMVVSNVYYDLQMNGMEINPANIKTLLTNEGFIKNSTAFNKRQQIWMNNAWAGDVEFIKKQGVQLTDVINKIFFNNKGEQILEADYNKLSPRDKKNWLETREVQENYSYIIAQDLSDNFRILKTDSKKIRAEKARMQKLISTKNSGTNENVDGAIIVSDKVLDAINADFGNPKSGQNKSFIVSPNAEKGALLGKYMMHAAGPEMSKLMDAKGLHMIMQESAVKQRGLREIGDYKIENGELKIKGNIYSDLAPEHVKGNFGVYGNEHFIQNQRMPKQMLQALLPTAKNAVGVDVINDAFEGIIGNRWRGVKKSNDRLADFLDRARSGELKIEDSIALEKEIIKDIENIGIKEIVEAMKADYVPGLSEAIYNEILRINKNDAMSELSSKNASESEYGEYSDTINEFNSLTDRVLRNATEWAESQRANGIDADITSVYMHKFVRDFRIKAVQNWIINSATKPKLANSGVGFMRPYDKAMRMNLDNVNPRLRELETNDEIFFLDNAFKRLKVNVEIPGLPKIKEIMLGRLWQRYNNPRQGEEFNAKQKEYVEDVLEAATVRVPMDSMSGSQVLKFAGFTGREGHGILMHGRAMKAEGGADLDGDKSFIFFGGKGGLDTKLKEAYKSNKEEFYSGEGKDRMVSDNKDAINPETKKSYKDDLVVKLSDRQKALYDSKTYQYSPVERLRISQAAVDGRNQLGPAVVTKQVMSAAYSSIMANGGKDYLIVRLPTGKKDPKTKKQKYGIYRLEMTARTSDKAKEAQRGMGRAQVGLASDPLDELGLTGSNAWFKHMWNAHFKITGAKRKGRGGKFNIEVDKGIIEKKMTGDNLSAENLRGGIYGALVNINQAYWGRNWAEGRKFSMAEIIEKGNAIDQLSKYGKNVIEPSILGRTGEILQGLDWSDSVFGKINTTTLNDAYKAHNSRLNKYDWLKDMLGRTSFSVKPSNVVINTMNPRFKLWTAGGIDATAGMYKEFSEAIKGTSYEKRVRNNPKKFFGYSEKGETYNGEDVHFKARRELLSEMVKEAEDYVINDMSDISTIMNVSKLAEKMINERDTGFDQINNVKEKNLNIKEVFEMIHRKVETLKKNSYLMAKDRRKLKSYDTLIEELDGSDKSALKLVSEFNNMMTKMGKGQRVRTVKEDSTAELDQMQIDNEIASFKLKLTENGKELFDQLMLGSLNRGRLDKIIEFENSVDKWDDFSVNVIKGLKKEAARTSISRLGFNSNSVSDSSIKKHIAGFANNFKETYRPLTKEQESNLIKEVDNYQSRVESMDQGIIEALMPSGYQGLKKGNLDKSSQRIVTEISDMMSTWSNSQKKQLPYLVRQIVKKDLNAMNKQDFVIFRNWLQDIQNGTWMQRLFQPKGATKLGKRHHMLFPRTVNKELMRDDLVMLKEKGFFIDAFGEPRQGQVIRPTHYVDIVQNFISKMNDSAVKISDEYIKKFNESMLFHSGLEDSQALWEIAIRKREASRQNVKVILEKYKSDKTVRDKAIAELRFKLGEAERKYNWKDKKGSPGLESKEYMVTVDGVRQKLTGNQIQKRINNELTNLFKNMHEFITGKEGALDAYEVQRIENGKPVKKYLYRQFIKDLQNHISGNTPKGWKKEGITDVPSYFGIDGLRRMAREMQLDMIVDKDVRNKIAKMPAHELFTKDWGDTYFPHMFFDKASSKKLMNEALKKIINTPESQMTEAQKRDEIRKLYYKNKSLGGDMRFQDMEDWDLVDDVLNDISQKKKVSEQKIKWFNANERSGSMKSRELHMGGYSIDPVVVESYVRSLSNTYHRQLSQMFGRQSIENMYGQMRGKWGQEQTNAWQNFMKLYVQDAIGNPAIIPERLYEDPKMKLKGTPYAWWADNRVKDRINKFGKAIGLGDKGLPEGLRGIDTETLRHWSNLEAQYQMATLLAHPKSAVANVFGGAAHTIQSAGWGNYVKARSINYLSKINPEWKTMTDVDNFVVRQGVLPEYLVYEMGLQKEFQSNKGKSFLTDLTAKLARDPEMSEKTIGEIASNYGLKDRAMNFAAKFMTIPERALRRDAFMAHYVHAWEKYGGAIKEYDHPYLVQLAKKGVRATQFLYNAPFRPAFARTSLGKMMTRFQLWGWNSVRFRNDVHRQAKIYGFRPGTEEWQRFERTMQTDLVTFALANVFAYSLFESNLPQPWGWAQDYADWIFGDEGERDKAFYGAWPKAVAPLQMVTPPGLRMVGPTFNALLSDDWSRIANYYAYTMMPFGRMFRDINPYAQGNLIENPMRLPEKIAGFPMMQLQRNVTSWKNTEDEEGNVVPGKKVKKLYPGMG